MSLFSVVKTTTTTTTTTTRYSTEHILPLFIYWLIFITGYIRSNVSTELSPSFHTSLREGRVDARKSWTLHATTTAERGRRTSTVSIERMRDAQLIELFLRSSLHSLHLSVLFYPNDVSTKTHAVTHKWKRMQLDSSHTLFSFQCPFFPFLSPFHIAFLVQIWAFARTLPQVRCGDARRPFSPLSRRGARASRHAVRLSFVVGSLREKG